MVDEFTEILLSTFESFIKPSSINKLWLQIQETQNVKTPRIYRINFFKHSISIDSILF